MPKSKSKRPGKGRNGAVRARSPKSAVSIKQARPPAALDHSPAKGLSKRPPRFPGRTGGR